MVAYEQELRSGKRRMDTDSTSAGADQQESIDRVPVGASRLGCEDAGGSGDVSVAV